jgi:hypothetical protein
VAELQNVSVSITILKGSRLRICQDGGPWRGRTTECISKYKGSRLIRGGHCHFILKQLSCTSFLKH